MILQSKKLMIFYIFYLLLKEKKIKQKQVL